MDDRTILVAVSEDEQAIIDAEIASGRYDDDRSVLRAGLAALQYTRGLSELRALIAESDADISAGLYLDLDPAGDMIDDPDKIASGLQQRLAASEATGPSRRQIPDIMADVKAKLRGHGPL